MNSFDVLHARAMEWVTRHYSRADHLVETENWLLRLQPEAAAALRLAALTHDMERAFPGPDSPKARAGIGVDHDYNRAHSERSARIVGAYLREQEADEALVEEVEKFIRAHEYGGWPEANLLQAADSLSFLEVNIPFFLRSIPKDDDGSRREDVRAKFDWMYERIQIPEARRLAASFHKDALERLAHYLPQ